MINVENNESLAKRLVTGILYIRLVCYYKYSPSMSVHLGINLNFIIASGIVETTKERIRLFETTKASREAVIMFGQITDEYSKVSQISMSIYVALRDHLITLLCIVSITFKALKMWLYCCI